MSGLRLTFYGDDFSGSTDAMEVLAQAGLPTRLYLDAPDEAEPGLAAVGVAGVSRSLPTEAMDAELRPIFAKLKRLGAPLCHYKVCSTFDSSPAVGSIGRAIDVGAAVFGGPCVPLVVGAPALGRYVAFGNLFARSGPDSPVYRLDRHPTMSRHPVTPMRESDLRLVLAEQTGRRVELVDAVTIDARAMRFDESGRPVVLFDTVHGSQPAPIGEAIWTLALRNPPLFVAGSSGVEYALVAHWRERPDALAHRAPRPVERVVAVSGSCSPVTAGQIDAAVAAGYREVALPGGAWHGDAAAVAAAVRRLAPASVVVHAAKGPDDPRIAGVGGERLGRFLGAVLDGALADGVSRVVVAGGDTSGYVARGLGVESLEFVAPVAPGSPLCRMHAPGRAADGKEICFKGGQVGKADFFELVRTGQRQT